MCGGGGGDASKAAERAERERRLRISRSVADIDSAFAGREPQYADFASALRELYGAELGKQQQEAARQTKFALARGGLTGGSAAIDAGRLAATEAAEGTLNAERLTRGKVADLRAQDEAARLQQISLAQSGNDIGNAAVNTANALRANLESAKATNVSEGIGDAFGRTAAAYRAQQDAAARRRGLREANVYANPFSRGET